MRYSLKADEFNLEYKESKIFPSVIRERHCHAQFEMIAVLDGDVAVMIEGQEYRLQKNQLVIIPPLCYHSVSVNGGEMYRRVTALFDPGAMPDALLPGFTSSNILVSASEHAEKLKALCQNENSEFYAPLAKSLMIQILYDKLRDKRRTEGKTDEFLQKAILYIDQNIDKKISLADLAKHTSRSESSFCHLFEEKMHISPKQYILQKKLATASKLLSEGVPPTVVAIRIGYDNYSNFYRMYLKHFGKNPTKR
jgi:AraC-like DNA-binding protein